MLQSLQFYFKISIPSKLVDALSTQGIIDTGTCTALGYYSNQHLNGISERHVNHMKFISYKRE